MSRLKIRDSKNFFGKAGVPAELMQKVQVLGLNVSVLIDRYAHENKIKETLHYPCGRGSVPLRALTVRSSRMQFVTQTFCAEQVSKETVYLPRPARTKRTSEPKRRYFPYFPMHSKVTEATCPRRSTQER